MPKEAVERLRQTYAAFSAGDFETALAIAHSDIEFIPPGGQKSHTGRQSLRAWMEPDAFESQVIEPLEFTEADGKVLVKNTVTSRGAASGIELKIVAWNVWTFDQDGLATRLEAYLEHEEAEAREAAGLD